MLAAFERRHEVLDIVVESTDRSAAVASVAELLGTSPLGGEAVMGMSFSQLTKAARRENAVELEDLNRQLTFTLAERPASSGTGLVLEPFSAELHREVFAERLGDVESAGDGSGGVAGSVDEEIASALARFDAEDAAWFVAVDGGDAVGIVFGEVVAGEVDVRVWVRPDRRRKGYGTAALRKSRVEMASLFPAIPMVVRAPSVS